jgi:TetR/AcrR family transcriptional repressor of nem operon
VAGYLSTAHRDAADGGFPSSSLVADTGRDGDEVQAAYAEGVEGYLAGFSSEIAREAEERGEPLTAAQARQRAIRLLSELVAP